MQPTTLRSALRVTRDFGIGLALFMGTALALSGDDTNAYARPGAATAQAHTIITLKTPPPQIAIKDVGYLVPTAATASIAEPNTGPAGQTLPAHPLNVTLLALMIATLTAFNLAVLRHVRQAYVKR